MSMLRIAQSIVILLLCLSCASGPKEGSWEETEQSQGGQGLQNSEERGLTGTSQENEQMGYWETLALLRAYPQIEKREFKDQDWALLIQGIWFFWEEGRLLPEDERENRSQYSPHSFYYYKMGPVENREITPELENRIQLSEIKERTSPISRHPGLFNALWNSWDDHSSYEETAFVWIFGKRARVHREIVPILKGIEGEVLGKAGDDPELKDFISRLDTVSGWNYRDIDGTQTRSMHSYGLAVDFEPKSYFGQETYWRWARRRRRDWYNIPSTSLWPIPQVLIDAFELRGFIWGGKWLFYDTMHFEYRPEILIYSSMLARVSR